MTFKVFKANMMRNSVTLSELQSHIQSSCTFMIAYKPFTSHPQPFPTHLPRYTPPPKSQIFVHVDLPKPHCTHPDEIRPFKPYTYSPSQTDTQPHVHIVSQCVRGVIMPPRVYLSTEVGSARVNAS